MAYRPIFLRQMTDAFLVRTEPASSMVKPAHIHMTSPPQIRKEKLFRTNWVSPSMAAWAARGASSVATANPGQTAARRAVPDGGLRRIALAHQLGQDPLVLRSIRRLDADGVHINPAGFLLLHAVETGLDRTGAKGFIDQLGGDRFGCGPRPVLPGALDLLHGFAMAEPGQLGRVVHPHPADIEGCGAGVAGARALDMRG